MFWWLVSLLFAYGVGALMGYTARDNEITAEMEDTDE